MATPDGARAFDSFIENPTADLLEIVTEDGYRLTVTPEHGLDVWTDGGFVRAEARDIMSFVNTFLAPAATLRTAFPVSR